MTTMNENTVNLAVWNFLNSVGCTCLDPLKNNQPGVDVQAEKDSWNIYVESKGTETNKDGNVIKFTYIRKGVNSQIGKLMKHQTEYEGNYLFVMANHDTAYTREHVSNVIKSTNILGFIQFWVQDDMTVKVEYPDNMKNTLIGLGLINE